MKTSSLPSAALPPVALAALLAAAPVPSPLHAQTDGQVVINGRGVSAVELADLKRLHGVPPSAPIPAGRYWYDDVSGLWGREGGPTEGQLLPGLAIGGVLRPGASDGDTGIFINGREIHRLEAAYLRALFGFVIPGRYWMDWRGVGGIEGGPPFFDLRAAARTAGGAGGGYEGYTRRTPFGGLGGDGNCSYYLGSEGSSVLTC